jgi:hypothetical protein
VGLDRVLAEHELGRALRVRHALRDEPQHLDLAGGEVREGGRQLVADGPRGAREVRDRAPRDARRDERLADGGHAHGVE